MSQAWKQTKLEMGSWKTRPKGEDRDREAAPPVARLTAVAVPLKRDLDSLSSKSSLKRKSPGSSSPLSSNASSTAPSPEHKSLPQPDPSASGQTTSRETPITEPSSNPRNTFSKAASLSFTSSQLPSSSGSQRIVRNGERMVTNSDDDDDSSSLEDLDDVLRLQAPVTSDRLPPPESTSRIKTGRTNHKFKNERPPRKLSAMPKIPNYKYSLAVLAEQQKQLQKSEVDLARLNTTSESRRQAPLTSGQTVGAKGIPDESVIDAIMSHTGDEEEVSRLKDALRRTEALHQDPTWSFFHARFHLETETPPKFPDLKDHPLRQILRDTNLRQQAFLNGYVEDYALRNDLPEELLDWILENTFMEKREDLRLSYIQVVSEIGSSQDLLNTDFIDRSFRYIGARDEALEVEKTIVPSITADADVEDVVWSRVLSTLTLIKNLSSTLKNDTRVHAICVLCRLLLDQRVIHDCNVMTALDETLSSLIESIPETSYEPELRQALVKVYGSVTDPRLRLQLTSSLPVYDFWTALFRRRLALAFFFEDPKYLKIPRAEARIDLNSIAEYLGTPRFKINKKTDYAEMTCSLSILDIGIDGGDPPFPFTSKKDERDFDNAVDRLSMCLKDISSQIIGASALDMRRTEAKETLHAMQRRLTYAVRSQPYVKKSFLANPEAKYLSEQKGMSEYLHGNKAEDG